MKIATFNINNINRRLPNLLRWLRAAKPDVVSLQELKATDSEFPFAAIEKAGYGAVWHGQKTWNGVAILARKAEPVLVRTALPGDRTKRIEAGFQVHVCKPVEPSELLSTIARLTRRRSAANHRAAT